MDNFDHLVALYQRLDNERARLDAATAANEITYRHGVVLSCEKEIVDEMVYLEGVGVNVTKNTYTTVRRRIISRTYEMTGGD